MKNQELQFLLNQDPIALAEKLAGKSYKEDDSVVWLGMGLAQAQGQRKDEILTSQGDSTFTCLVERYLSIVQGVGFRVIVTRPAKHRGGDPGETHYMLWHDDGLFLAFDTFHGQVNGSHLHYNVRVSEDSGFPSGTSGCIHDGVLVGDLDGREAILHNISRLKEHGEIMPEWVESPWLKILTSGEYPEGWDKESQEELKKTRSDVQALIPTEIRVKMALA